MDNKIQPYTNSKQYYTYEEAQKKIKEEKEDVGTDTATNEVDDSQRYEIDTDYLIEKAYNGWLGRSLKEGIWQPDPKKKQMMSKELADKLRNSIQLKINTHSNLSIYDEDFIRKIAIETCEVYNEGLMYEAPRYNLSNYDFRILIVDIKHLIMQLLRMALGGTMARIRADSRKTFIQRREDEGGGVLR